MAITERRKDPGAIAEALDLPERVGNYANMILDRLEQEGHQIPADARTYPAVVYVAARDEGEPVTAEEVADAGGVQENAVSREFRRIADTLGINPIPTSEEEVREQVEGFIRRFASNLDADGETEEVARELYSEGVDAGLFTNRTGAVTAGLCLYAASQLTDDDLTQVAFEEFGVSRTSIRKAYKDVLALRGENGQNGKMIDDEDTERLFEVAESIHETLGVPDTVLEDTRDILETVRSREWVRGKSPEPIGAGAYWLGAKQNRIDLSQSDVAELAGTHKVTVNRRVGSIRETLEVADEE